MIFKPCLCIPTYNNPATIQAVIQDCLQATDLPVLVVDDGSEPPVKPGASPRVTVLTLPHNQGKGVALQRAMRECTRLGFTHLVSIDGDGQHLASDIPKLLKAAAEHPWDLIIGNRKLSGPHVPEVSRFGRKFSNFWVRFQTDTRISDSQSGFRVYPLFQLQCMRFFTRRFDFEIEVLIRLLWKGVGLREVEIDAYYPEPSERVSHFDKLWDNVRISCLNTVLVTLSLLRQNQEPARSALALGLGAFVGTSPFYGLHTLISAGVAVLFRLNFVYLWAGSQISIPPLAPLLVSACVAVGRPLLALFGFDAHGALSLPAAWLAGWPLVGGAVGAAVGLAFWFTALARKRKLEAGGQASWNGRSRGGRFGNAFLRVVTRRLGLGAAYFCLYFIVPYFYLLAPKARRSASEYWSAVSPQTGWLKRQVRIFKQLMSFARVLLDRVYQGFYPEPRFEIESHGMEHVLETLRAGQGLILLGAHVGGWELAAALLKDYGLESEFHMIRYQADGVTFESARGGQTPEYLKSLGTNRIESPMLAIRGLLDSGVPVGLMGDRPGLEHLELVPFFGKLAPIDTTPFRVAAATGKPLLFTFGFKARKKIYEISATPARIYRYAPGEDRSARCREWAAEFARELEARLRNHPEQWFNFFPFFSEPPLAPPAGARTSQEPAHSTPGSSTPEPSEAVSASARKSNASLGSRP